MLFPIVKFPLMVGTMIKRTNKSKKELVSNDASFFLSQKSIF